MRSFRVCLCVRTCLCRTFLLHFPLTRSCMPCAFLIYSFIHSTITKPSYRIIHIIIVVVVVVVVDIVNNSLTGSIPSELGNLVALNLTHIFVADNALTGDVPSDLRDIVYMNCIICARPRDVRGRGLKRALREYRELYHLLVRSYRRSFRIGS